MMSDEGLTETLQAFLSTRDFRDKFGDMSADEIEALSFAGYAARTGRTLTVTPEPVAARQAHPGQDPQAVAEAQHPARSLEHPQDIDFSQLSMSEYSRVRERLGIGRSSSARGIFGN